MSTDLTMRYGTVSEKYSEELAAHADEGPIWMINLMAYRSHADYSDGRVTSLTGREVDDLYAPLDALAKVGAEIVFLADVESQLLGDSPKWDRVAIVKYPTRGAFLEMVQDPDYAVVHQHKDAGMSHTFIVGGIPFDPPPLPDDAPSLDNVPFPSTPEDGRVVVCHVLRYKSREVYNHMETYQMAAGAIAVPLGVRLPAWFQAEGTLIGDGRTWDQIRFNAFPSKAAFMALVFDPERLKVQGEHRETAIEDTYTMILRPVIDNLEASVKS
jgi:uncharacterized protein (DUF1330 family)